MHMLLKSTTLFCAFMLTSCAMSEPEIIPGDTLTVNGKTFITLPNPVNGCKAYRQQAKPGQMVIQVIYFKHPDGKFSPIREGAICD